MKNRPLAVPALLLAALLLLLAPQSLHAGSATWNLNPASGDWNAATNWMPPTVPNAAFDIATFTTSSITAISISQPIVVFSLTFNVGASAYTITCPAGQLFTIGNGGVTNNSGILQSFLAEAAESRDSGFHLTGGSAGDSTVFTTEGGAAADGASGSVLLDISTDAGGATFVNEGGLANGAVGGELFFEDSATAGTATITNQAGLVSGASGGLTWFLFQPPTAGSAVITSEGASVAGAGGGMTLFQDRGMAASATLIAKGGTNGGGGGLIQFLGQAKGGTARVEVFGNGSLDISQHSGLVAIGSLEGDGQVLLGSNNLTIGGNNLSTTFSGVMQNSGSLTKTGSNALTLTGARSHLINV